MKGIVFTVLQQMIEEQMGLKTWDKVITEEQLDSGGVYTAAATYKDEEAFKIVGALSRFTGLAGDVLLHKFGSYMLKALAKKYAVFFENTDLKNFLFNVDRVIHKEVRKLYPDAQLPVFRYIDTGPDELVMEYVSSRKLCALAEGLIQGAAEVLGETYSLEHTACLRKGNDCCRFEVKFLTKAEKKAA